jgi:hypothetical protein
MSRKLAGENFHVLKKAIAQLNCLIGESFPHRLYLADCWLTSLYVKLATDSDGIENIISLIQENYQSLHKSPKRQGTNKVDCRTICEPVLTAKGTGAFVYAAVLGTGRHAPFINGHLYIIVYND